MFIKISARRGENYVHNSEYTININNILFFEPISSEYDCVNVKIQFVDNYSMYVTMDEYERILSLINNQ